MNCNIEAFNGNKMLYAMRNSILHSYVCNKQTIVLLSLWRWRTLLDLMYTI